MRARVCVDTNSRGESVGVGAVSRQGFSIHDGTAHVHMSCPSNAPPIHTNRTTVAFSSEHTRTNVANSFTPQAVSMPVLDKVDVREASLPDHSYCYTSC